MMAQVEPRVLDVVGVLVQVLAVIASLFAGPAAVTEAVAEPEVRPVDAEVTVQEPGTPVIDSVIVSVGVLRPAAMGADVGETLQTLALSTEYVTVVVGVAVVVMPLASLSVAVTGVDPSGPAGKADWPSVVLSAVAAPGPVKVMFVWQPTRRPPDAES